MLVIRRYTGQSVQVGDDVEIVVIECAPGRVKLGVRAPRQVAVMRSEVRHTREQNLSAAGSLARTTLDLPRLPAAFAFRPDGEP